MVLIKLAVTVASLLALPVAAAPSWTVDPINPPAIPLAVKHPYLNTWLPQGEGVALNDAWPQFWTGDSITAWTGFVRVDGKAYRWLGSAGTGGVERAVQTSFRLTSARSIFTFTAGPVNLTVTFLSVVSPQDLLRHSIPFSYLYVDVKSRDGAAHNVQVYNEISAEWAGTDNNADVDWNTTVTNSAVTHSVGLRYQAPFEETKELIRAGTVHITTKNIADSVVRPQFATTGQLSNTRDSRQPRPISDQWPVFAFAVDLGNLTETAATKPALFAIGHTRDATIQYIVKGGALTERAPYWRTRFNNVQDMISFYLSDWQNAVGVAHTLDSRVQTEAGAISKDYQTLVLLSLRQAFAAMEPTVGYNSDGSINKDDVLVFMKEISSNGNMNTADVIYPAWPILLWMSPEYGRHLLEPLLQYQASGLYPNKWALHDMGAHYPRAIAHNDGGDEAMPVEESGNMLIMLLSYAQATGDVSQLKQYYDLMDQWTQYLITDSLIPAEQLSTDDFAGHLVNQTNLAIKGIIGIKAMSMIAELVGDGSRASNYSNIAAGYVQQFQTLATSKDGTHLTLNYNNDETWGTAYNLYADKLIGANIFPQSIYDMQTAWYKPKVQTYGLILDTRNTWAKTDWATWVAAISDDDLKHTLIKSIVNYAANGRNNAPFGDLYYVPEGKQNGFRARPVAGGHLALVSKPARFRHRGLC
ncbi:DUF1793-domain-containing protein [Auriculariales sp. MPI-PUGE-AT-0066]|nr:DUF1793-domain-containing protein [Auriculariales sp. MPI-PUGE-AT-0066]